MEVILRIKGADEILEARHLIAQLRELNPDGELILGITEGEGRQGIELKPLADHVDLYVACGTQKWRVYRDFNEIVPHTQ